MILQGLVTTMDLSYLYHLIYRLILLFMLVSAIPVGFLTTSGHFAEGNNDTYNNSSIPSGIINACNSHLYTIGNESSGKLTLQSSNGSNPCSIFLTGPKDMSILFNFQEVESSTFRYLFVERLPLILPHTCSGRFVVFNSAPVNCNVVFHHNKFLLHLRGKISLQLEPFATNVSASHDCLHPQDCNTTCSPVSGTCNQSNSTQVYNNISHCTVVRNKVLALNQVSNVTTCQFYCAQGCNCTLHKHQLIAICKDQVDIRTFIVYPDDEIKGLHLGDRGIGSLSVDAFSGFDKLRELSLANNSLSDIPFGVFIRLRRMRWLDLSGNQIAHLEPGIFQKMSNLDSLNLGHNLLAELEPGTFGEMLSLDGLYLNDNNLRNLNTGVFHGMPNLKWLNLENNKLADLQPGMLDGLSFLQNFNLRNNQLTQFQSSTFKSLSGLTVLDLHSNGLVELKPDSLGMLPALTFLQLENNNMHKIHKNAFQNVPNLISLSLSNNQIEDLRKGVFSPLKRLRWLRLDGNLITNLKPGIFRDLDFVDILLLQHNNITVLNSGSFDGMPNLAQLNLTGNTISEIRTDALKDLTNLKRLYLNANNITTLRNTVFDGMTKLERLYLRHNEISEIEPGVFGKLRRLEILYLEGNQIKSIPPGVFVELPALNIILLTNNQLTSLSKNSFQDLNRLHYLNLENNSIQWLGENFCSNCNSLETLNMIGNPLKWARTSSFSGFMNSTLVLVDDHATCCFVETVNCTAQNQKPVFLTCERLLPKPVLRIAMWILGMCALCGNAFVLYTRLRQRRDHHKVQSRLIIHLSCSDLLMGIYMILLTSADIHFGVYFPSHANAWRRGPVCQIASVLSVLSSEASVFFLTLISIDRLLGVRFPFSSFRLDLHSTKIVTTILWVFALTLSILPLPLSKINPDIYDVSEVCIGLPLARKALTTSTNKSVLLSRFYTKRLQVEVTESLDTAPGMYYSIAVFIGLNLVCFIIIAICYVLIFLTVKRSSRRVRRHHERDEEMRMAFKMALIVLTDFCCWMPVITTGILVQSGVIDISPVMYAWMVTFVLPINSSINPFMYTIATITSDRLQKRKPLQRVGSVMNYSQDQKTVRKSSSDNSSSVNVRYNNIKDVSSSQVPTDDTNKTSVSQTVEMTSSNNGYW